MRLSPFLLLIVLVIFSCKKDNSENEEISDCALRIKEIVKEELKCTEKGVMEVNLYTGVYQHKIIYFTMTMCPACNTFPPQFGYTCDGTKVSIEDFNNTVTEIKEVYNSCKQSFQ